MFVLLGGGQGEFEAQKGGGGGRFSTENARRGGGSPRRGGAEGLRGCLQNFGRGGQIFFSGPKFGWICLR